MKKLLSNFYGVLAVALLAVVFALPFGATATAITGTGLVLTGLSILVDQHGVALAGLNKEIWLPELMEGFYADDMLHPSQIAIDYIWIRFFEHYVNDNCFATMQEVCNIQKGLAHRPFNPKTKSHQQFLETLNQKIISLKEQFPHFQF